MDREVEKHCKRHGTVSHVLAGDGRYRCRACRVFYVHKRRLKVKKKAVDYLGGSCKSCGYDKYIGALDFHHRDPAQKDFLISSSLSWDKIVVELDKCDLLCSNCHREEHYRLHLEG